MEPDTPTATHSHGDFEVYQWSLEYLQVVIRDITDVMHWKTKIADEFNRFPENLWME
jgi:hypothetical protein